MFSLPYYHSTTRNLVIAFGNLFNDIWLVRKNAYGNEAERMKVPIGYGPKQKWWVVQKEDPSNVKRVRLSLPAMGFEITSLGYDSSRQLNPIQKIVNTVDGDYQVTYVGTPYSYLFELNIITQNSDDGFQIVEQILPYFTPTQMVTVRSLPQLDHRDDVPVTMISVNKQDDYEGSFERLRFQTWSLAFNMRTFLYGPVKEAKLIRKASIDIHVTPGNGPVTPQDIDRTPRHIRIVTEPNPLTAEPEDDYGFTITTTEYDDNRKRDPVSGLDVPAANMVVNLSPQPLGFVINAPTVHTT